ncbi:MAG: hypothetical protein HYT39_02045 [Candidatus Sungbacteria bacterium]|nr:hypothetical protein [Candidatus Sungbacteria bacterium]
MLVLSGWFVFSFSQVNAAETQDIKNVISQSRKIILETPNPPNLITEPAEGFLNNVRKWFVLGIRQSHLDEYNELYLSAQAYKNYALQELGIAEKFLVSGNADIAREHIERSASYQRLWHLYDSAALEVWSRNIEKAQEIEYEIGKLSASIPGLAGKAAGGKPGGALMGAESLLLNYWLDSQFKNVSTADRNAAKDVIVGKVAEVISEEAGLKVSASKLAFGLVELNKLTKTGVSAPEEIAKFIANELEKHETVNRNEGIVSSEGLKSAGGKNQALCDLKNSKENNSPIRSKFFENDITALKILNGETQNLDIRAFSDNINHVLNNKATNLSDTFAYKVISALRMLGMTISSPLSNNPAFYDNFFEGEDMLNKFKKLHKFERSPFITREILQKIDEELAVREKKDKELACQFPLFYRFTDSLPNQPTKEHIAALYTVAFKALPPNLVNWNENYFEKFLKAQFNLVSPEKKDWQICTGDVFMYGVPSGPPCPARVDKIIALYDDLSLINTILHEYGHFLDDALYGHALTIDTKEFHASSFKFDYSGGYLGKGWEGSLKRTAPEFVGEFVSGYAANSGNEDFAESFSMYVMEGRVFRELAKRNGFLNKKYVWLKNYVFKGVEYDTGDEKSITIWENHYADSIKMYPRTYLSPVESLLSHPYDYSVIVDGFIFYFDFPRL